MKWSGHAKYNSTSWTPFTVAGTEKGSARVAEPLSFLRVSGGRIRTSVYKSKGGEVHMPVLEKRLYPFEPWMEQRDEGRIREEAGVRVDWHGEERKFGSQQASWLIAVRFESERVTVTSAVAY